MSDYQNLLRSHAHCMVCGPESVHKAGVPLLFIREAGGKVSAEFQVGERHQGYTGLMHGGMTSTLLDAAMTHCLLMSGIQALTAELTVRFMAPIRVGQTLQLSAQLLGERRGIYQLEAWLRHGAQGVARARAKFITSPAGVIAHVD
jgi:uncharacterized protein (TIGR00369 family)